MKDGEKVDISENPIIKIRELSVNYGANTVLQDINLDVHKGEIIGYIGPNGAGKSTTVKVMLGLLEEYSGTVEIDGKDIADRNVEYKRKIGYVPEIAELYENLTAREYLSFIGELYGLNRDMVEMKAEKMIAVFQIAEVYDARISSYSKGMKQKVMIIASLLHDPDILFLDEPLSGLDANSVIVVKEILAQLAAQGKTIFYSSHIMEVVEKISSRIVLLKSGQIVADGSFAELKERSKEGSLEEIFNQLTGFTDHRDVAREFVSIVQEG